MIFLYVGFLALMLVIIAYYSQTIRDTFGAPLRVWLAVLRGHGVILGPSTRLEEPDFRCVQCLEAIQDAHQLQYGCPQCGAPLCSLRCDSRHRTIGTCAIKRARRPTSALAVLVLALASALACASAPAREDIKSPYLSGGFTYQAPHGCFVTGNC